MHSYKKPYPGILILAMTLFILGCTEKKTQDPEKSYRYWAGENPPSSIRVINGQYWESSHWSKEYELYLEIIASPEWIKEFKAQNNLKPAGNHTLEQIDSDRPGWFKPNNKFKVFSPNGYNAYPTFYEDSTSGHIFISESQL